MPRITVPADKDPLTYLWSERARGLTGPAGALSSAIYERSALSLREFEAARTRIAQINGCELCLGWRTARDVPARGSEPDEVPEELYDRVGTDPTWAGFSVRERLVMEFAERFALDHLGMDDDLWARLHAAFSDDELVDLGLCVGAWIAFGRLNQVFDVDGACRVPLLGGPAR
jgi:alkylhydroperoxidase family enzyme